MRVTDLTRPVLRRGDHQEINMEPVYRRKAGIDVHKKRVCDTEVTIREFSFFVAHNLA